MFNVLNDHILDQDPLNNHVVQLVYVILRIFLLLDWIKKTAEIIKFLIKSGRCTQN